MEYSAHWFLSALMWLVVSWHVAAQSADYYQQLTLKHVTRWRRALHAVGLLCLFVLTFGCARSIDSKIGVFSDLSLTEFCVIVGSAAAAGAFKSFRFYAQSGKELPK